MFDRFYIFSSYLIHEMRIKSLGTALKAKQSKSNAISLDVVWIWRKQHCAWPAADGSLSLMDLSRAGPLFSIWHSAVGDNIMHEQHPSSHLLKVISRCCRIHFILRTNNAVILTVNFKKWPAVTQTSHKNKSPEWSLSLFAFHRRHCRKLPDAVCFSINFCWWMRHHRSRHTAGAQFYGVPNWINYFDVGAVCGGPSAQLRLNWIPTAKEARQRGCRCAKIIECSSIFIAPSGLILIFRLYRVLEGPDDSLITTQNMRRSAACLTRQMRMKMLFADSATKSLSGAEKHTRWRVDYFALAVEMPLFSCKLHCERHLSDSLPGDQSEFETSSLCRLYHSWVAVESVDLESTNCCNFGTVSMEIFAKILNFRIWNLTFFVLNGASSFKVVFYRYIFCFTDCLR